MNLFQSTHPHGVRRRKPVCFPETGEVSIHAPTRGATIQDNTFISLQLVSIHAPTRGATDSTNEKDKRRRSFNPRTHTGCDVRSGISLPSFVVFQSTHPHGVRLSFNHSFYNLSGFQSTHPHGVRLQHTLAFAVF